MVRVPRQALIRRARRRPPRKRRRLRWVLAALAAAALALFLFWPANEPPPEAPPVEHAASPPAAAAAAVVASKPAPAARVAAVRPKVYVDEREALLAAVRERASSLRECAAGELTRLPLRLHVARSGAMRAVEITGDAPPAAVATCVRKKAMSWTFERLQLPSDMELLVAISFAPGA